METLLPTPHLPQRGLCLHPKGGNTTWERQDVCSSEHRLQNQPHPTGERVPLPCAWCACEGRIQMHMDQAPRFLFTPVVAGGVEHFGRRGLWWELAFLVGLLCVKPCARKFECPVTHVFPEMISLTLSEPTDILFFITPCSAKQQGQVGREGRVLP